ncbi:MAG: Asp-tRNA(Asn)/Glu-tRNA(Gln) amidotransferase subunit GatC [Spirochaetia bacterium]|nr:Asp-tRNA(Asn)/Glu-tRNA(Gln) amidotransferase subunit GatC [Spirochaetia bacterium]MBP5739901.1 Asp-tRNA(Asn)/Glu-tRNA(Gln) amidotransferase subunit GatC [Spirochaetia bacterium]
MQKDELYITASLARLELTEKEAETLSQAVSQMIEYFSMMEKIDVTGLEPTTHVSIGENRVRKDEVIESTLAETMIEAAPERDERFITVPHIL